MKKLKISFVVISLFILVATNSVYYISTKNHLETHQKEKIEMIVSNVKNSIDSSNKTQEYFNIFLAQELRKSSIAIKYSLPSDYREVSNEQLTLIADELNLEGVSLIIKEGDTFVVKKTSMPQDMGLSTKTWGNWHLMLKELYETKNVTPPPGYGESRDNFWSGPIGISIVKEELLTKWGYFYDGTTNYIITTAIDDKLIKRFEENAGVDKTIQRNLEMNPYFMEVSVLNRDTLLKGEHINGKVMNYYDRLIWYGTYNYHEEKDKEMTEEALALGKKTTSNSYIDGKKVQKYYIPINFEADSPITSPLVLVITTDYEEIQSTLSHNILSTFLTSIVSLLLGFLFMYFSVKIINKKERTIFNVQEMYSNQVDILYKTVRESRHDSTHHLYTISGLASMELYEELKEYVAKLLEIKSETSDIININIPAFSGLLQAKIAEAFDKRIKFEHNFENFNVLQLDMLKVSHLVRIVGNILDNAFHAVLEENEPDNRKVIITGRYQSGMIQLCIYNNGIPIPEENLSKIFSHGFTTRRNVGGSGLGLSSAKKILEDYKGTLTVDSDDEWTGFTIQLPVTSKELLL